MIIAMRNRMSLINFDAGTDLTVYTDLLNTEMTWLFRKKLPAQVLFIPDAYEGVYYNSYLQKVIQIFSSFNVGIKLISDGNPADLIKNSVGIVAGGGSLQKLLEGVNNYKTTLKAALASGKPYLGWNEGAVLPCPYYVVPAVLPLTPTSLGATLTQTYTHFVDTDLNRLEIKNFLVNHKNATPQVNDVVCFVDHPGGSGIRLEDDIIALSYEGGSPGNPNPRFALGNVNQLITL
jgi:hypothetical protein